MPHARPARGLRFFFQAITPDEARAALAGFSPVGTERVSVAAAAGRVLAEDIDAPTDLPHFGRANMDGSARAGRARAAGSRAAVIAPAARPARQGFRTQS